MVHAASTCSPALIRERRALAGRGAGRAERGRRADARAGLAIVLGAAAALLAVAPPARADIVQLMDGEEVRGRIVREEPGAVILEVGGGRLRIDRARIKAIVREDAAAYALGRGRDLLRQGRAAEAVDLLRGAVLEDVPGARLLFLAALNADGESALAEARLDAASERFGEAARFAERVPEGARPGALVREAARAAAGQGAVEGARAEARAAYLRGRAALHGDRLEEARAALQAAVRIDHAMAERAARPLAVAAARLGIARAHEGRLAEAAALFEQALADDPTLRADLRAPLLHCRIGAAARLALAGQDARAEALLDRAVEDDPGARLGHFYLGVLWEGRGADRRASGHYHDALRDLAAATVPAGAGLPALRAAAAAALAPLPVPVEALWQARRLEEARRALGAEARRGGYVVRAPERAAAEVVLAAVEQAARDARPWAGAGAATQPIHVYVFARLETLHRVSGQGFHALGLTRSGRDPATGSLIPEVYTALDAPDLLAAVIPHEVAHALVGADPRRPLPLWLNEGLAVLSEPPEARALRVERYRANRARGAGLALVDVIRQEAYPEGPDALASFYDGSTALAAHLVAAHGREAVLAAARRDPEPAALLGALGLPRLEAIESAVLGALAPPR